MRKKTRKVQYSVFGLRPSVSFCLASATNFCFGASLIFLHRPIVSLKGIVHPKNKIISLITHCHVVQIKIFLMKSESTLTLHRQQGSYHGQGQERYQELRQNSPCDISDSSVATRILFVRKKIKIMTIMKS